MDWDLWSAAYDPEDHNFSTPLDWQLDFYFRCRRDAIEEDAVNEKCCIQVLRILISKADTEIDELEQDLIFLQSELAWIENEEWSEIGYNTLTKKIDFLDTSMKSLRNEGTDNVELHLLMHTQPVERLHEILKALLSNYRCKKDLQPANAGIEDPSCHPLKLEAGFSVEVIKSNNSCPTSVKNGIGSKSGFNAKEQSAMQKISSTCEDKGRHNAEKLEILPAKSASPPFLVDSIQPANVGVNDAISEASQHADDSSNMMNKLSNSDSLMVSGHSEEDSSISTTGLVTCSSAKPMVIKTDAGEKDVDFDENLSAKELKCANELNENGNVDPGLGMPSDSGNPDGLFDFALNGKNKPTAEDLKLSASEIVTSGLGMSSDSGNQDDLFDFSLNGKNEATAEELKLAASQIVTSRLGMSSDPGNQDDLFDFALNGNTEPTTEELKVAASGIVTSLDSSVRTEREDKNPQQILKVVEAALTEKENCALTLLLEQQDKKGNNAIIKIQPKEEDMTIPEVEMSVIAAHEKFESNLHPDLPQDLQKEKMKGSMNPNPLNLPEVCLPTMIVDTSSSFVMKGKKRQKSVAKAGSNPERKMIKKVIVEEPGKFEFRENGDEKPNPISLPLKKPKSLNTPSILNKDVPVMEIEPIPTGAEMEKLKLQQLRIIAREHKVTKYSHLKKNELVQLLVASRNGGT
ncbi:hypothetical protein M5689_014788 [Euphorbia peplus]|nr:hypothetical protein M5689_014788 [Euphorbia peplus]